MAELAENWQDITTNLIGTREPAPITERIIQASPIPKDEQEALLQSIRGHIEPLGLSQSYYLVTVDDVTDKTMLLSPRSEKPDDLPTTEMVVTKETHDRMKKAGNIHSELGKPIPGENIHMIKALLYIEKEAPLHTHIIEKYMVQFADTVRKSITEKGLTVADVVARAQADLSETSRVYATRFKYESEAEGVRQAALLSGEIFSEVTGFFEHVDAIIRSDQILQQEIGIDAMAGISALPDMYFDREKKLIRLPLPEHQMEHHELAESRRIVESLILDGTAFSVYQTAGTPFLPTTIEVSGEQYTRQNDTKSDDDGLPVTIVYTPSHNPRLPEITFSSSNSVIDAMHVGYQSVYPQGVVADEIHSFTLYGSFMAEGVRVSFPNTHGVKVGSGEPHEFSIFYRKIHDEAFLPPDDITRIGRREWIRIIAGNEGTGSYGVITPAYADGLARIVAVEHNDYVGNEFPALADMALTFIRGTRALDYTHIYNHSILMYSQTLEADGLFWGSVPNIIEDKKALADMSRMRSRIRTQFGEQIDSLAKSLPKDIEGDFRIDLLPIKNTRLLSELGIGTVILFIDPRRGRMSMTTASIAETRIDVSWLVWNGYSSPNKLRSERSEALTARVVSAIADAWENGELEVRVEGISYSNEKGMSKKMRKQKEQLEKGKLRSAQELVALYLSATEQQNIVRSSE